MLQYNQLDKGVIYTEENTSKVILWGLGKEYNSHVNIIKIMEKYKEIEVIAVTAKDIPQIKKLDKWHIVHRRELENIFFDYIIICSVLYENLIISDALDMGISRNKLIPVRVFDIPYFNWKRYIQIRESKLSIISCNCWGGILCNTLGMECLSPFKNLSVKASDILHIVSDLKKYMIEKPIFTKWQIDPHSMKKYPVMRLRDIEIHFNHDTDIDEAISKWTRRKKKLNYDNIMVMIYTEEKQVVNEFIQLNNYKKICFVPNEINEWDDKEIFGMNLMLNQTMLWESVNVSAGNGIALDILKMLSGEKKYRYE